MNFKNKILISISSFNDLSLDADGYVLGYEKYTLFAEKNFLYEEIKNIKEKNKIYLLLNALINENEIEDAKKEIKILIDDGFNLIISDFGLFNYAHKIKKQNILIFQSYTLISNKNDYFTYQELFDENLGISPFIDKNDLIELSKNKGSFIYGFGYLPLYQSHRKVLSIYEDFHQKALPKQNLFLKEDLRNELYPIIENQLGSVIFKSHPISLLSDIDEYNDANFLFLDFLFLEEYKSDILMAFKNGDEELIKELEDKVKANQ